MPSAPDVPGMNGGNRGHPKVTAATSRRLSRPLETGGSPDPAGERPEAIRAPRRISPRRVHIPERRKSVLAGCAARSASGAPGPGDQFDGPASKSTLSTISLAALRLAASSESGSGSAFSGPQAATTGEIGTPGFTGYSKFAVA